jgi:histidinol dehydrogenase
LRVERMEVGEDPTGAARRARALAPGRESITDAVAALVAQVRDGGDAALRELVARLDGGEGGPLRLSADELAMPLAPEVEAGMHTAIANVMFVAGAGVGEDTEVTMPQGHRIVLREVPVRRAAVYVPGGRSPLPSTLVMGVVTARAAGVEEVCVATPPPVHPVLRGAATLLGVSEVYAMGGAHAVAALAYVHGVDKIVGPGNAFVNEAKLLVSRDVAIDLPAGPSEVVVALGRGGDRALAELELAAQAEHGPGTRCVLLENGEATAERIDELAAEHVVLLGDAEALAPRIRNAGAVFVGASSPVAAGDYATGGNHVLPTGGWARSTGGLGLETFLKPVTTQRLTADGLAQLRPTVEALAAVEGMTAHARAVQR